MTLPHEEMITPEPEIAWLEADEWEGDNGLLGNRQGLEILRESIDQILMSPEDTVVIPVSEGSIRVLKLCDPPRPLAPCSIRERILLGGLLALFLLILLLGISSLIGIVTSFFH